MQRLLKSGTVGAVLPNGGRIHHYVSCNDSLGCRHVELNETFLGDGHDEPEQNLLRSAGRAFSGSEVFDDLFWGREQPLSWLSGRKFVAIVRKLV